MDLTTFFDLSYGMFLLSTLDGVRPTGCLINTLFQVTDQPPVLALSLNRQNFTNECLKRTGRAVAAILDRETPMETLGLFGFHSGRDVDKFSQIPVHTLPSGLTIPAEHLCGWLEGTVLDMNELSTHTVFYLEVCHARRSGGGAVPPMTYSYYHRVKNGPSSPKAPHHGSARLTEEKKWTCTVCGYQYDGRQGPFEDLPPDWKCPLCGVGKDLFQLR